MPWSTLEVRWFLAGLREAEALALEAWLRARRLPGSQPAPLAWDPEPPAWRQDRYLMIPGSDDMGIKWRAGRLEIKGREAGLGRQTFAPGLEGFLERWVKWSYAGEAIERRFADLFRDGAGMVPVEKRRLQRHIRLDAPGEWTEVSQITPRKRGVNVELALTRLSGASSETHWSLAFEAFPGDPAMAERLAGFVARFLDGCPVLPLAADRSMSYARWLHHMEDATPTPG